MQDAQVQADGFRTGRQRLLFYFTGEGDVPVVHIPLDRAGFDLTHQWTVQPDLETHQSWRGSAPRTGFALAHACQPGQSPIAER